MSSNECSLYGDTLREVARLVNVETAFLGDVVRQELERHNGEEGGEPLGARRDLNDVLAAFVEVRVSLVRDDDTHAAAREHLLEVPEYQQKTCTAGRGTHNTRCSSVS